jgi:cell division protein FtsW
MPIRNSNRTAYQSEAQYDWWLISCVGILIGLGLVMVASASISIADPLGKEEGARLYYFWRQVVALGLGLTAGVIALKTPLVVLKQFRYLFLLVTLVLLVIVISPLGKEVNGAARWVDLGVYDLQASEIAKLLVIIYLAGYMETHLEQVRTSFSGLYNPIIYMTNICRLLLMEPDFGTSVLLFACTLGLLFIAGIPLLRIIVWGGIAVMVLAAAAMMSPYRMQRLLTFMDPWADPYNTGFQLTQALIAIGRGEWFGVGLGSSVQKLFYLPEAHTDFIFAVFAEEMGLIGCLILIVLFTFFIWRVFYIAAQAERGGRYFPAYLAYGFGLLIGMQAFFNMGVNMGALPTKGLTLPFISYGGCLL